MKIQVIFILATLLSACLVQETIHNREPSKVSSAEATGQKSIDFLFDVGTTRNFEENLRIDNDLQSQLLQLSRTLKPARSLARQVDRREVMETIDLRDNVSESFIFTGERSFVLQHTPILSSVVMTKGDSSSIESFEMEESKLSLGSDVSLTPNEIVTVTYTYISERLTLQASPAAETLLLSIDGVALSRDQFDLDGQEIILAVLPPAGTNLKVQYREFQPLQQSIQLPEGIVVDSLLVSIDERQLPADAFEFNEAEHSLKFLKTPADGSLMQVDYMLDLGPKLNYSFAFQPVSVSSIEVLDASTGEDVPFDMESDQIVFPLGEYKAGRELILRYKKQSDIAQSYQLNHEPINDQFSLSFDNESCLSGSGISRSGRTIKIDCELAEPTQVRMAYAYLATRTRFTITNIADPDRGVWEVYYDEDKSSNWIREGSTIIVPDDLSPSTRVRIRFSAGKHRKPAP